MDISNLPWIEKYRPRKLKDLILEDNIKSKIDNIIKNQELSNLIISGTPGNGKTSTILCIAREIYGKQYKNAIIELNASDNRGLDIINNNYTFCKKKYLYQIIYQN